MNLNLSRTTRIGFILIYFIAAFFAIKSHNIHHIVTYFAVALVAKIVELVLWSCQESAKDPPVDNRKFVGVINGMKIYEGDAVKYDYKGSRDLIGIVAYCENACAAKIVNLKHKGYVYMLDLIESGDFDKVCIIEREISKK